MLLTFGVRVGFRGSGGGIWGVGFGCLGLRFRFRGVGFAGQDCASGLGFLCGGFSF